MSDAETCPHCGADHGSPRAAENPAAIPNGLRLFASRRGSLGAPSPYPSVPEEAEFAGTGEQRWDNSKTVTLGAVLLALIAGGVIYSQSNERDAASAEAPAGHSAYGAIDMKAVREVAHETIAAIQAKPAPADVAPVTDASTRVNSAAVTTIAPVQSASVIDNLQAARDAIDRGDLTTARRRLSKIPAAQMSAGNIQRTQSELVSLERTRDNLLQMARACEATGSWICVRQNARDVLSIDASNVEAQTLVEHAINRSGWLNKTQQATAHAAPKGTLSTPLATATAPAFVAGQHPAFATSTPAASARKTVSAQAAPLRPIPVMPATVGASTLTAPGTPVASDSTRVGTGSQVPLTSTGFVAAPQATASSAPAPATTSASASASTSTFIPMPDGPQAPAVRSSALPSSATITPAMPATTAPVNVARALVSGDNAANPAQPKTFARSTTDSDAEERAILESGWTKGKSSMQPPPSQ